MLIALCMLSSLIRDEVNPLSIHKYVGLKENLRHSGYLWNKIILSNIISSKISNGIL